MQCHHTHSGRSERELRGDKAKHEKKYPLKNGDDHLCNSIIDFFSLENMCNISRVRMRERVVLVNAFYELLLFSSSPGSSCASPRATSYVNVELCKWSVVKHRVKQCIKSFLYELLT